MKKKLTFLLLVATVSFNAMYGQTTRQYSTADMATLYTDLEAAVDGDIFELTESGGIYELSEHLPVKESITIRALPGLEARPIISRSTDISNDYMIRIYGDNTLVLDGIELKGDGTTTKYAIRTAKLEDYGYTGNYTDATYDDQVKQLYALTINNCYIHDIIDGSDGRAIIMYPGTKASLIKIENSIFSDLGRYALDGTLSTAEKANGHWRFADSIAILNSTFYDIQRDVVNITTADSSAVSKENKLFINHCNFDNNGYTSSYHVLEIDYVETTIRNCIFSNDASSDYISTIKHPKSSVDYIGYYNITSTDNWSTGNGSWVGDNMSTGDPLYTDYANKDFTLGVGSPFTGKASDGSALGDLRWDLAEARLADLTVDGTTVIDFQASVFDYNVYLPFGTTDIPVIASVVYDTRSTAENTQATELPGAAKVVVTAADGVTTLTYTINFILGPSNIATLSDLMVNNVTVAGFDPEILTYNVELAPFTTEIPVVMATTMSNTATFEMVSATTLPGSWFVNVTAEDQVTKLTYAVNFTLREASTDATLADLKVDGATVTDFNASTLEYTVELAYGTTNIPEVLGTAADTNATVENNQATALPGDATVNVIAEDGTTSKVYTVHFILGAAPTYTVTFTVKDESANAIEGADITFNGSTIATDASGVAAFTEVSPVTDAAYSVSKGTGYEVSTGTVSVVDEDVDVAVVLIAVGITQNSTIAVTVYPNPSTGVFTITNAEGSDLVIFNVTGTIVYQKQNINNNEIVSGNLNKGIYFVQIINSESKMTNKIVIE